MFESLVRQNYSQECEAGINKQINLELHASYVYLSLSFYFEREDLALKGFSKFFREASDEERQHAMKLMKFQNSRGGRIVFQNIQKPEKDEWGTGMDAMKSALALEKSVNQSLLDLHKLSANAGDAHMSDFLEENFLREQVDAIKKLADYIAGLKLAGPGLGEFMFDKETFESS